MTDLQLIVSFMEQSSVKRAVITLLLLTLL